MASQEHRTSSAKGSKLGAGGSSSASSGAGSSWCEDQELLGNSALLGLGAARTPTSLGARSTGESLGGTEATTALGARQLYAHGGYWAAVTGLVEDPEWLGYLQEYTPEAWAAIEEAQGSEAVQGTDYVLAKAMGAVENNPVVAAYGMVQQAAVSPERDVPIEWDVWLDEEDAADLSAARIEHGGPLEISKSDDEGATMPERIRALEDQSVPGWLAIFQQVMARHRGDRHATGSAADGAALLGGDSGLGGVFLDIKSGWSTAEDVAAFVHALEQELDLTVHGVGSFTASQLVALDGEQQFRFFHSVGDLLGAEEVLQHGDRVMFNAYDLVDGAEGFGWWLDEGAVEDVVGLVARLGLHAGFYTQEKSLSPGAHARLVELANERFVWFDLGYAYGNVDGRAASAAHGDGTGGQNAAAVFEGVDDSLEGIDEIQGHQTRLGLSRKLLGLGGASNREVGEAAHRAGMLDEADPQAQELVRKVSRAEAAKLAAKAEGHEPLDTSEVLTTFSDLPTSHWASGFVYGLVRTGVLRGLAQGGFGPEQPLLSEHADELVQRAGADACLEASFDPTAPPELVEADIDFASQRLGTEGLAADTYGCFDFSKHMVQSSAPEGQDVRVLGPWSRYQLATSQNADGSVEIDEATTDAGLAYLDSELDEGRGVVVGVSYTVSGATVEHWNADRMTDHFVVINGRRGRGEGATYTFLDPWAQDRDSAGGEFTLEDTGKLAFRGEQGSGHLSSWYEVTMIRVNEVQRTS